MKDLDDESAPAGSQLWRIFVVDFFGSLVPGATFIMAVVLVVWWPTALLVGVLDGTETHVLLPSLKDAVAATSITGAVLLLIVSYVAGCMFARRDPKAPDRASFRRVRTKETDPWVCQDEDGCQFPYANLREYLIHRHHYHLLPLADWGASSGDGSSLHRSKSLVNFLKARLAFHFPDKIGELAKNEGHVRLMSSAWYMSKTIRWAWAVAASLAVTAFLFGVRMQAIQCIMPATIIGLGSFYVSRFVEQVIHYQRVREVILVLETAHIAFRHSPHLLTDLCPKYDPRRPSRFTHAAAQTTKDGILLRVSFAHELLCQSRVMIRVRGEQQESITVWIDLNEDGRGSTEVVIPDFGRQLTLTQPTSAPATIRVSTQASP